MHYRRQKRYGTTDEPQRPTTCAVDGCEDPVQAKALCDKHYRRNKRGASEPSRCHWCGNEIDVNANAQRKFCNKECKEREEYVRRRENHRSVWLKKYGLTPETFDAMLVAQGGGCAICGTLVVPVRGSFCVDHDHATGRVRGLLCVECNSGLGQFKDDRALLRASIDYLSRAPVN